MSHKSGHIIVQAILPLASVSPEARTRLQEIETRDEYNIADKIYLAALVASIADDPAH